MSANGQYDSQFTRQECRAIRRCMRQQQGINSRVLSAVVVGGGEAEVVTGSNLDHTWWRLRRDGQEWKIIAMVKQESRI